MLQNFQSEVKSENRKTNLNTELLIIVNEHRIA